MGHALDGGVADAVPGSVRIRPPLQGQQIAVKSEADLGDADLILGGETGARSTGKLICRSGRNRPGSTEVRYGRNAQR